MADHRCYRCVYHTDIGPRDVRERVRCYPRMKTGGPEPFWVVNYGGKKVPYYHDMDSGEIRGSEDCPRFAESGRPEE